MIITKPFKVRLQRFKCNNCGVFYQTRLNINLNLFNFNEEIKENPGLINSLQPVSLRNIAKIMELNGINCLHPNQLKLGHNKH